MKSVMKPRDSHPSMMPNVMVLAASAAAVLVGGVVLVGWAFDIPALKSVLPGWVSMKPNAALAFILTGIALQLPDLPKAWLGPRLAIHVLRLESGCRWLVGLIGLLTLAEYLFDWNAGFDQWLFPEPAGTVATSNAGRMAPETALCFLLLATGAALARLRRKTTSTLLVSMTLGTLVTILALAALLTYVTPVLGAFGWWGKTVMAVHTAILFTSLGTASSLAAWRESPGSWALPGRTLIAYAIGLGLLVMVGVTTMRVQNLLIRLNDSAAQLETTLYLLENLGDHVSDAQSRVRGYVLTGDEQMRTAHDAAVSAARKSLEALRSVKLADPGQQARLAGVEALTVESLQWFGRDMAARHAGPGAATELIGIETQRSRAPREDIDQLQFDLKKLVGESRVAHQNASYFAHMVTWAGMLLSLIVLVLALLAWNREAFARAATEQCLRDEEMRFRQMAEFATDGIVTCDRAGDIVGWNRSAERMFGYTTAEVSLRPLALLMPQRYRDPHAAGMRRLVAGAEHKLIGKSAEFAGLRRDGSEFPLELSLTTWEAGGQVFFSAFMRDITERKQAEAWERERAVLLARQQADAIETQSKARLLAQKMMEDAVTARGQAEAMTVTLDTQLNELRRWQKVTLGREGRILRLKKEINSLMAERGQPPRYVSALDTEPSVKLADRITGVTAVVSDIGQRLATQTASQEASLAMLSLLEDQVQNQAALSESEVFGRAILDSVAAEIAVLDPRGTITAVNQPWRSFALENSIVPGEAVAHTGVGENYLALCSSTGPAADEAASAREGIQAVLDGRLPNFSLEYSCHSPQQERWFGMNVTPLVQDGQGAVVSHVNITARKQAEAALLQRNDELTRFNRVAVDREIDMIGLKRKVNALSRQLGQAEPFNLYFAAPSDAASTFPAEPEGA
jgi:PAS domain S-box-containing protein